MSRFIFVALIGFILASCEQTQETNPPLNLLPEPTYIDVYIELHLFNALVQAVDTVMNQDSLKSELFNKYSITEKDFIASHSYYQSQTLLQQARLDTAVARLARSLEIMNTTKILQPTQAVGNVRDSLPQN